MGIGDREHERARAAARQSDELGPVVTVADLGVERRHARSGRKRHREQRERRAVLLLATGADHAVGGAGPEDRRVRREIAQQLGELVRLGAVLAGAEQRDEVGRALEHRTARGPRLGERSGRPGELRERSPGAHPDFIDGLCAPLPTITTWRPAISTSRLRPAWNARFSLIVT